MKLPELAVQAGGVWQNPQGKTETPPRFVLYYEIEYQHRTCGETYINGERYPVEKDTLIFARPGDVRYSHFQTPDGVETSFFRFSADGAADALLARIPHAAAADAPSAALWQTAEEGFARCATAAGQGLLQAALTALLFRIATSAQAAPAAAPTPIQQALFAATQYMNAHLGEPLTVAELAAHIGYSRTQFSYLFRTYTGHTPHAYFRLLRIFAAKRMLLETDLSLSDIAAALGFSKVSKFGSAFRDVCGVSPGKFRRSGENNAYET